MADNIHSVAEFLGAPYIVETRDHEPCICRRLPSGHEIEVSGVTNSKSTCSIYVWQTNPRELMGIYRGIKGQEALKDILGYYAAKYQNLIAEIQVERED